MKQTATRAGNSSQDRDIRERATMRTPHEERPGLGGPAANPLIAIRDEAEREQRRREAVEAAARPQRVSRWGIRGRRGCSIMEF